MAKSKTQKERHPLYHTWAWMRRMDVKFSIHPEWKEDFYKFVADVGERPTPQHRLYRKNEFLGYSKENCYWREIISCKDAAEYQREWRKQNPDKAKNNELKRRGTTLEEFNRLLKEQNEVCAVCKQPETFNGSLAVDHCHQTGRIRGLLCTNCNRGLGLFKDSIQHLQEAIRYISS